MALKSKRNPANETEHIHYPCLMVSPNDNIILFTAKSSGVILSRGSTNESDKVGGYYTSFCMTGMKPYHGEIILSNKTV